MMLKYIKLFIAFTFFGLSFQAQQQTQYSQYLYSMFSINPAYAGNKDNIQLLLTERKQWTGIEGAPHSQSFIFHSPIKSKKMGYGVNIFNESIGAHGVFGAFGSYSYSIKSPESALSFGLRAGVYSIRIQADRVTYRDGNDPSSIVNIQSNVTPSFDAGMHYYKKRFVAGLTFSNLTETKIKFTNDNIIRNNLARHFFAYSGYLIDLSSKWKFQPSAMLKYTVNSPINIDVNANFIFKDKIGIGASYRSNQSFVAMAQLFFGKNFRLGYSFDYELNLSRSATIGGSHEIFVGLDFNRKSQGIMSPRYL
jgi:type IX secretion system PorP/SprF family membrane protein